MTTFRNKEGQAWWHTHLIPALKMLRQVDLCELEFSKQREFQESLIDKSCCKEKRKKEGK